MVYLRAGVELANQLVTIAVAEVGTEPKHVMAYVIGFKVGVAAFQVNETAGSESAFLIEHDANAPACFLNGLMTAATPGLARRRPLGAVDALQALVSETLASHAFEVVPIGNVVGCLLQGFQQCLRKLAGRAWRVEPQSGLAFGKQIGNTCAEAQLAFLERATTSAAFGATATGGFEHVRHKKRIPHVERQSRPQTARGDITCALQDVERTGLDTPAPGRAITAKSTLPSPRRSHGIRGGAAAWSVRMRCMAGQGLAKADPRHRGRSLPQVVPRLRRPRHDRGRAAPPI